MVNNRMLVSREAQTYKKKVALIAALAGVRRFDGEVVLYIEIYRPAKRGDLDNSLKVMVDSLKGIAFDDDSQIGGIEIKRFEDPNNPRAEVTIRQRFAGCITSQEAQP